VSAAWRPRGCRTFAEHRVAERRGNARWFDVALGTFSSADSWIPSPYDPPSLNRYGYALNNPLRYTDPTGHRACEGPRGECSYPGLPVRGYASSAPRQPTVISTPTNKTPTTTAPTRTRTTTPSATTTLSTPPVVDTAIAHPPEEGPPPLTATPQPSEGGQPGATFDVQEAMPTAYYCVQNPADPGCSRWMATMGSLGSSPTPSPTPASVCTMSPTPISDAWVLRQICGVIDPAIPGPFTGQSASPEEMLRLTSQVYGVPPGVAQAVLIGCSLYDLSYDLVTGGDNTGP
jgi:RHS repeat-associated protein